MYIIQEIFVSNDILDKQFCCDLDKCKGACCYKGDFGAPLLSEEITLLTQELESIKSYLPERSLQKIKEEGLSAWYKEISEFGTIIHDDGACVFMTTENGIAQCGIEKAFRDGKTDFQKPISCHLYPARIKRNEGLKFEAINYDEWDICKAALEKGVKENIKLINFLEDSIVRLYGQDFYKELKAAGVHME